MNPTLKRNSFKDWFWNKGLVVIITVVLGILGWQQELIRQSQKDTQVLILKMIDDVSSQCKDFDVQIMDIRARQIYDRSDIDLILRELDLERQVNEYRKTGRSRGIVINKDTSNLVSHGPNL